MEKRQSKTMFIVSLLIYGTIFTQMALYVIAYFVGWDMKFNLVDACQSALKAIGMASLKYALDALVIYTLVFSGWKLGSQWIQTMKMKRKFQQYRENKLTIDLNKQYSIKKESILVISYPVPLAITMGFISPKIMISTGLMNLLTEEELEAVIYHEMYHQRNDDPLKLFLLSLCASSMAYIPILKWFNQKYRIIQEVMADHLAIEKQATSMYIGSALLKMLKVGKLNSMPFVYASFADTSVNYRIEYILNPLKDRQLKIPMKIAFKSFTIFSLICIFFIYALA
ncbi:M56 family metallopeptidase [Rummeliibacillus pycnus]|uniref:M56 family metallopeptidase n=1 Tax=Rummeliibacillus pycnus TaxID=101070 RepID=UPI000C9B43D3|nr:M56 family metallopeptidase [Rummeliibacillus pycnus]